MVRHGWNRFTRSVMGMSNRIPYGVTAHVMRFDRSAYFVLLIAARFLAAVSGFILVYRLTPAAVGGYHYLQATVAIPISLLGLNLDVSINARLSQCRADGAPFAPVLIAGGLLTLCATLVSTIVVAGLLLERNAAVDPPLLAGALLVATCAASLVNLFANGVSFALGRFGQVAAASTVSGAALLVVAGLVPRATGSLALLAAFAAATALGVALQALLLRQALPSDYSRSPSWAEVAAEFRRLVTFGSKQGLITTASFATLWLLQTRIASNAGLAEAARYGLANQIYNLVIFLPSIANPIILQAMIGTRADRLARQRMVMRLSLGFTLLVAVMISVTMVALPFVTPFLPGSYAGLALVGTLAVAAAGLQLVRTPSVIHFTTDLRARPDLYAAITFVAVVATGFLALPELDAVSAMVLRLVGQCGAGLVLFVLFMRDIAD